VEWVTYFELGEERAPQWPPQAAAQFMEMIDEEPKTPIRESPTEKFFETGFGKAVWVLPSFWWGQEG